MPPLSASRFNPAAKCRRQALTLTELLAVLAVIALLACVQLPGLARVKTQTWITQCSGNLRQVALSFLIYGEENKGLLWGSGGYHPWDLSGPLYQAFSQYGSVRSNLFYCPSNPYQSVLWNYGSPGYHVTGYAYTYPGVSGIFGGVVTSNINYTTFPQQLQLIGTPNLILVPSASSRVLTADAEICAGPSYDPGLPLSSYNFSNVQGGAGPFPDGRYYRASHLAGALPLGGNAAMLDGRVDWRPLRSSKYNLVQRNAAQPPNGTPCFLW